MAAAASETTGGRGWRREQRDSPARVGDGGGMATGGRGWRREQRDSPARVGDGGGMAAAGGGKVEAAVRRLDRCGGFERLLGTLLNVLNFVTFRLLSMIQIPTHLKIQPVIG